MEKSIDSDLKIWRNSKAEHHRNHDLPSMICNYQPNRWWHTKNKSHREYGLASSIYSDGYKLWYNKGDLFREGRNNCSFPIRLSHLGDKFYSKIE